MSAAATVREERLPGQLPIYAHPGWAERFPWLIQGTTARGEDDFDLRLFGDTPVGVVIDRWRLLRERLGVPGAAHARQVHGADILVHEAVEPGLSIAERFDGHYTRRPRLLLTVSVADCVPISLIDAESRAIAVLHGGWRGVAAGILEAGVDLLRQETGGVTANLFVHFGPAICGACYEVGPEVFRALGLQEPAGKALLDVRGVLAERAQRLGLPAARISVSEYCTRCGDSPFYSHRGGCIQRQVGFLALRG